MRCLVVDDEVVSRSKMQKILSQYGHCHAVESGQEALTYFMECWAKWQPLDLITLDVKMPEMDGDEVLFSIREMEGKKGVQDRHKARILMVSSLKDKDTVVTCIQAGCDNYVMKPFNSEDIKDKLIKLGLV